MLMIGREGGHGWGIDRWASTFLIEAGSDAEGAPGRCRWQELWMIEFSKRRSFRGNPERRSFPRKTTVQMLLPSCQAPNILGRSTVLELLPSILVTWDHINDTCSTDTCNITSFMRLEVMG